MKINNFAGMTVKDFLNMPLNIRNKMADVFEKYYQIHERSIAKTNAILEKYTYEKGQIPMAFKANMYIKGKITSSASNMLRNFRAPFDSFVYKLCQENNICVMGQVNMDEFAMGSHNTNSAFGCVLNPIDLSKRTFNFNDILTLKDDRIISPGGSSGGSAVAVNAGVCLGAFGTDTGGSVRGPSELSGLACIKPTFGQISRNGVVPLCAALDVVGIMAKTIEDVKYLANIFYKEDPYDSVNQPVFNDRPIKKRIATINEIVKPVIEPEAYDTLIIAQEELKKQGYIVEEVQIEERLIKIIDLIYSVICYSSVASDLSQNGIFYGRVTEEELKKLNKLKSNDDALTVDSDNLNDIDVLQGIKEINEQSSTENANISINETIYNKPRGLMGAAEVKRRIIIGKVLSSPKNISYITKAWMLVEQLYQNLIEIFNDYDCIMVPINGHTAFLNNLGTSGSRGALTSDVWLCLANLCGMPAVTVPIRHTKNGIYGVQLVSDIGCDRQILDIGEDIDKSFNYNESYRGKFSYQETGNNIEFTIGGK